MTQNKQDYTSPLTTVLELRLENVMLITSSPDNNPNKGYDSDWDLGTF